MITCREKSIGRGCIIEEGVKIVCDTLILGDEVIIGVGTDIYLNGRLEIGSLSNIAPNAIIRGNNVTIGSEFWNGGNLGRLMIGGGGWSNPQANLVIGDRCGAHNNYINLNRPITMGNHVGLSPNVALITHGYWQSVLRGFPFREGPITIKDNGIFGWGSTVLAGVTIGENAVVAAGAVVTEDVEAYHVVGGVPAKTVSVIKPNTLSEDEKVEMATEIIKEYKESLAFRNITDIDVVLDYPIVRVNDAIFDLEKEQCQIKQHTAITDDFRDFVRRKGIWFYGRRFKSISKEEV